ncbi:MAG: phosphatase PAP2 family protein [Acidobacteriota bacterium]|nr:MAG: phosphatase PAP2 family protein [Acidobacteriota bacterium]
MLMKLVLALLIISFGAGCATMRARSESAGRGYWPSEQRWSRAAREALRDPGTWAPAAGAAVIAVGDWDEKIAEWAVEQTPVFGSPANARSWSDDLRTSAHVGMLISSLAVPPGDGPWESRLGRVVVDHGAGLTTGIVTGLLKDGSERVRPDRSDDESFPSAHSSMAFSYASAGARNLEDLSLSNSTRRSLRAGFLTVAAATGWARVEAGVHYPADVLFGAALGHFIGRVIHDAFLGSEQKFDVALRIDGDTSGVALKWSF